MESLPLLPGYVFAGADPTVRKTIWSTPRASDKSVLPYTSLFLLLLVILSEQKVRR